MLWCLLITALTVSLLGEAQTDRCVQNGVQKLGVAQPGKVIDVHLDAQRQQNSEAWLCVPVIPMQYARTG